MSSNDIPWHQTIKKEARGINNEDFGKVQQVEGNYVFVKKGIINKEMFYIPKDQVKSYDGEILKFKFSDLDLSKYQNEPFMTDAESNTLESDINKLKEELDS
jgi:hypothetical protein